MVLLILHCCDMQEPTTARFCWLVIPLKNVQYSCANYLDDNNLNLGGVLRTLQEQFFALWQREPDSAAYNTAWGVYLAGDLDLAALQRALSALVARHEVRIAQAVLSLQGAICGRWATKPCTTKHARRDSHNHVLTVGDKSGLATGADLLHF